MSHWFSLDRLADRRQSRERGSVIVTTLIALLFVMTMGTALLSLTMSGLKSTRRIRASTNSFNLAESGLERAARWFKDQGSPPSNTSLFYPIGGTVTTAQGTYTVTATPDPANAGAVLKKYTLESTGVADGKTERIQLVIRQSSFGKYAYFTDKETSSASGGRIWFYSGDRIRGPAHSNNKDGSEFQINWQAASANPIFEDTVTSSGDFINYDPSAPNTEAQFAKIFRAGSRGYELGVDEIPLPSSSDMQKVAAWGPNGSYPGSNGVYCPPNGGIYIRGDASITMSVDASNRQRFSVVQGSNTVTITVDRANDVIYRQDSSGTTTIAGAGNGVVYCTGNITALSGTIADNTVGGSPLGVTKRSAFTIATDVNNNKNITITGNLKHKTAYNPNLNPTDTANLNAGTVGLIGRNVTVASGAPTNMEIDAVILAGSSSTTDGSFSVADYNTKTPTGSLKVLGGIIQKARGAVGTLSGGSLATGYAKDYWYDARMADNPPPFFPTTGGYDRISWRRLVN